MNTRSTHTRLAAISLIKLRGLLLVVAAATLLLLGEVALVDANSLWFHVRVVDCYDR
jgi:hypothetical protein